jgi:CO/xanthine dehydrogenase FAD-binding subunit
VYLRPTNLDAALRALEERAPTILAGGTDFYPARVGSYIDEDVLDITALGELSGIRDEGERVRIGALTRWTEVIGAPLPRVFDGLALAAREIGGVQIQNAGTVGGNLCNASPAADGVPALMSLDAEVELAGPRGRRTLALTDFITGNRQTTRAPNELLTGILIPKWSPRARGDFLKLGSRRYLVISIAMVATVIDLDEDLTIRRAGLAVGACSPVARRLTALEARLVGERPRADLGDAVMPEHLAALSPITDVRATAAYRQDAVLTLLKRSIGRLANAEA